MGGWRVDGEEEVREGMTASNRLGDRTGHHLREGVALLAPAQWSPGSEREVGGGGWQTHTDCVEMGPGRG